MARRSNYLVEIRAHTGDQVETLYLSTQPRTNGPMDTPANQTYRAAISDLGSFERSFAEDDGTFGPPSVSYGYISISNANGEFDGWQFYGFGREIIIKDVIDPRARAVSAPIIFRGIVHGVDMSDARSTLRLRIRDRMAALNLPLLTERYAGTTTSLADTAEGDVDLQDVIKPRIWGAPYETVPCKLVNRFSLIYQVSSAAVDSITVYDEGIELTNDGDSATIAALNAATIAGGHYRTCLALGLFRLGDGAAGTVTAHVVEGGNAENRSAARVAQRILVFAGETVDEDSFDTLYGDITDQTGICVSDESSILQCVSKVLGSVEAGIIPGDDQALRAVRLVNPADETAVDTLTEDDLDKDGGFAFSPGPLREGDGIPAWSVIVNWGRIFAPQRGGDLSSLVDEQRRAILGLETRPAKHEDATIKVIHPTAPQIVADTLLIDPADAANAAGRRFALYSTQFHRRCSFPVQRERADYPIGTILAVDISRHGYAGGVNVMVIGRRDDFTKRRVTYRLWG